MVLFLDLNSFFASVEQQLRPELRGRPVGIIPNDCDTTCCIAASYEAKHFGIKTGCGVRDARLRCPGIALVLSRPDEYITMHHKVLEAVDTVYPVDAVYSIDEMAFRLTGPDRNVDRGRELAMKMKSAIRSHCGEFMRCSIGIAPNRLLAKSASNMMKPDGLVVIERSELPQRLYPMDLTDFPGISDGIRNRLHRVGIHTTEQLCRATKATMRRAWGGVVGEVWYHWLQGDEPHIAATKRRNCGHQHVLAPELRGAEQARAVGIRLLHKAAARMRHEGFWCTKLTLKIKPPDAPSWVAYVNLEPCQDTIRLLWHLGELWKIQPYPFVFAVSVTLGGLTKSDQMEEPLFELDRKRTRLAHTMDRINQKHGHASIYYGSMHEGRDAAPRRIPFSTIPDLGLADTGGMGAFKTTDGSTRIADQRA